MWFHEKFTLSAFSTPARYHRPFIHQEAGRLGGRQARWAVVLWYSSIFEWLRVNYSSCCFYCSIFLASPASSLPVRSVPQRRLLLLLVVFVLLQTNPVLQLLELQNDNLGIALPVKWLQGCHSTAPPIIDLSSSPVTQSSASFFRYKYQ